MASKHWKSCAHAHHKMTNSTMSLVSPLRCLHFDFRGTRQVADENERISDDVTVVNWSESNWNSSSFARRFRKENSDSESFEIIQSMSHEPVGHSKIYAIANRIPIDLSNKKRQLVASRIEMGNNRSIVPEAIDTNQRNVIRLNNRWYYRIETSQNDCASITVLYCASQIMRWMLWCIAIHRLHHWIRQSIRHCSLASCDVLDDITASINQPLSHWTADLFVASLRDESKRIDYKCRAQHANAFIHRCGYATNRPGT